MLNYIGRFNGVKTQIPLNTIFKETKHLDQTDDETFEDLDLT